MDLWGALKPTFAPVLASDEASGLGDYYWESDFEYLCSFHSLVVGKVTVFSVVDVKETVLEDVDGKVAVLLVVVVKVARPQGNIAYQRGRLDS